MIASHQNLLTPAEVERDYRISTRTQRNWRKADAAFRATVVRLGRKTIMFDRAAIEAWIESRRESQVQK